MEYKPEQWTRNDAWSVVIALSMAYIIPLVFTEEGNFTLTLIIGLTLYIALRIYSARSSAGLEHKFAELEVKGSNPFGQAKL